MLVYENINTMNPQIKYSSRYLKRLKAEAYPETIDKFRFMVFHL